jgi:hypothetical protein
MTNESTWEVGGDDNLSTEIDFFFLNIYPIGLARVTYTVAVAYFIFNSRRYSYLKVINRGLIN